MGTLTSAGGTTFTSPFVITSGAGGNPTSARTVTANQQLLVKAGGGVKMAAVSAATIHVSGASTFDSEVTFAAPIAVTTAAGVFAVVTALTTSDQSAGGFLEASGFDLWLKTTVCGRDYGIPLVSATF